MDPTSPIVKPELIDQLLRSVQRPEELWGSGGLLHKLKGALMERMLEAEMTEHLGYEPNEAKGRNSGNSRNGHTNKTVETESGPVEIRVPRDRAGSFEPKVVTKHQRRIDGFDEKVLALYARGMSVREIQSHLRELYGTDISPELITRVTDSVLEEAKAWQNRPLEALYPIVYLDALFVSIRDGGAVKKKAVYLAMGVTLEGTKEVLGLWIQETEGARFWLQVLTELKNRGIQDIFFVCCDGLSGFPQAIQNAFPKAVVQTCIVHMIRNSMKYVSFTDRKKVVQDLRPIYAAATEPLAQSALEAFDERWGKRYPTITTLWKSRWTEVVPFLSYPNEIRKILYTTNAIESLNFQLRKVLRPKGAFPSDDAVLKVIFLALKNAQMRWKAHREWKRSLAYFAVIFKERFPA